MKARQLAVHATPTVPLKGTEGGVLYPFDGGKLIVVRRPRVDEQELKTLNAAAATLGATLLVLPRDYDFQVVEIDPADAGAWEEISPRVEVPSP